MPGSHWLHWKPAPPPCGEPALLAADVGGGQDCGKGCADEGQANQTARLQLLRQQALLAATYPLGCSWPPRNAAEVRGRGLRVPRG